MKEKSRHYDAMKFVATLLVVFAHSSRMYTGAGVVSPLNPSQGLAFLTQLVYSFHMPFFMAVSGMVYGLCVDDLGKYRDTRRFLKNKVLRLLVPYLFFGLAYVAPVMVFFGFTDASYAAYCCKDILLGEDPRHLWYLAVLFEVFLLCAAGGGILRAPGVLPVVGVSVLLACASFVSARLPATFQLRNLAHYTLYFHLGFVFNRFHGTLAGIVRHPVFLLAAAVLVWQLSGVGGWIASVAKAVLGGLALAGLSACIPGKFMGLPPVVSACKNGFGIYLFHPMAIYVLYRFFGPCDIPPVVLCCGIALVAYGASWLASMAFRRMKLAVLLGE